MWEVFQWLLCMAVPLRHTILAKNSENVSHVSIENVNQIMLWYLLLVLMPCFITTIQLLYQQTILYRKSITAVIWCEMLDDWYFTFYRNIRYLPYVLTPGFSQSPTSQFCSLHWTKEKSCSLHKHLHKLRNQITQSLKWDLVAWACGWKCNINLPLQCDWPSSI